jgi:hypothetical protein
MSHTSEKRWGNVNESVGAISGEMLNLIMRGEELYQQLLELWAFTGGTDQAIADQLFIGATGVDGGNDPLPADAEQVAMAADAKAAMVAMHEMWQFANGVDLPPVDRTDAMRRMT